MQNSFARCLYECETWFIAVRENCKFVKCVKINYTSEGWIEFFFFWWGISPTRVLAASSLMLLDDIGTHTLLDSSIRVISSSQRLLPARHTTNTWDEYRCCQPVFFCFWRPFLVLCLYCTFCILGFFFLIVLHFAFCLYSRTRTTQTSMLPGGIRTRNPSNRVAANLRTATATASGCYLMRNLTICAGQTVCVAQCVRTYYSFLILFLLPLA
jgi:hypothetical protein